MSSPDRPPAQPSAPAARPRWALPVVGVVSAVVGLAVVAAALALVWSVLPEPDSGGAAPTGEVGAGHPAVVAVRDYDRAYRSGDCELFVEVTSERFREDTWNDAGCAAFAEIVADFRDSVTDHRIEIVHTVADDDGTVLVGTLETYVSTLPEDEGERYRDDYVYRVVQVDGSWVIDGLTDTTGTQ